MKNIIITQKIFLDKYKQANYSLEENWIRYFNKKKFSLIPFFYDKKNIIKIFKIHKPHAIIFSGGGNDIFSNSKENKLRRSIEKKLLSTALKKKIPILAVCYGFQFIAKSLNGKIIKVNKHAGTNHNIRIINKKINNKININSFHNYGIISLPKHFESIGIHNDRTIEMAISKKFKILGIMFHPERKNKSQLLINNFIFKHFDK